jgi:hypothetical protein
VPGRARARRRRLRPHAGLDRGTGCLGAARVRAGRAAGGCAAARAQQGQAAQRDAGDDGGPAGGLGRPGRVAEQDDARHGADQRLDVVEGAGHLGGYPALPVGEEREGQHRAADRERRGRQDRARVVGGGGHALSDRRERQRRQGGAQELRRGDRDRVTAAQQALLGHGEYGGQQQRREHQAIAERRGAAAPAAGDQADSGQRQREPGPGHRAGHGAPPERRDDRDHHRHGADQQRRVGDAGAGDAGVLHDDRPAVPERSGRQHPRGADGAHAAGPGGGEEDRGGQAEAREGEPARRQPLQGQLGQRHGRAPEQACGGKGGDGAAAVGVHASMLAASWREICYWRTYAQ